MLQTMEAQRNSNMVTHIIKQGETVSSIAKQYKVSNEDIFRINNLNDKTILHIGQKLVIPTGKSAIINNNTAKAPATVKPVAPNKNQYLIVPGDNLSRIAKQYHVTEQQLREWNNLKNNNIRAGDYLNISGPASVTTKAPAKTETKKPELPPVAQIPQPQIKKVEEPAVKPTPKIEPPARQQESTPKEPVVGQSTTPVVKPEEKPIEKEIKSAPVVVPANAKAESYFETQYNSSNNSVEGICGTFKTIAGWQDKKYYALLNNVESGSIVKISANNKIIYAKVLGPLPNVKDDTNLALRISNAAAASLGFPDKKFNVKVEF